MNNAQKTVQEVGQELTEMAQFSPRELADQTAAREEAETVRAEAEKFSTLASLTDNKVNTFSVLSDKALAFLESIPETSTKNGVVCYRIDKFTKTLQVRPTQTVDRAQVNTLKKSFGVYKWDMSKGGVKVAKTLLGEDFVLISGNHRITAICEMLNDTVEKKGGSLSEANIQSLLLVPVYIDTRLKETEVIYDAIAENVAQRVLTQNERLVTYVKELLNQTVRPGSTRTGATHLLRVSGLDRVPPEISVRVGKLLFTNETLYSAFLAERFKIDHAKEVLQTLCATNDPLMSKEDVVLWFANLLNEAGDRNLDKQELRLQLSAKVKELRPNAPETPHKPTTKAKDGNQGTGDKMKGYDLQAKLRAISKEINAVNTDLEDVKVTPEQREAVTIIMSALSDMYQKFGIVLDKSVGIFIPEDQQA